MSLITCHECKNQVSTEAKTCPGCGAKVKKPTGLLTKIFLAFFGLVIVMTLVNGPGSGAAKPVKTPEEKAKSERENLRFGMAKTVASQLKAAARDPDSLVIESMRVNDDSSVICTEYRARNGFGGMNRELFVVLKDRSSHSANDWNKHCTKSMYDMMWAIK